MENKYSNKSWLVTLLLTLFLGWTGAHRFYVGRIFSGIIILVISITEITLAIFTFTKIISMIHSDVSNPFLAYMPMIVSIASWIPLVWVIVDLVMVASGKFKDKDGKVILNTININNDTVHYSRQSESTAQKIREWHKLYKDGVITLSEYEAKKNSLLDK